MGVIATDILQRYSALLVLNGVSFNIDSAVLALNWWFVFITLESYNNANLSIKLNAKFHISAIGEFPNHVFKFHA